MDQNAADVIRGHALAFLRVVDDGVEPREVRMFACHVVSWALLYVRDEFLLSQVFGVLQRAVERDETLPLGLVDEVASPARQDSVTALIRLGDRAMTLGRMKPLARITSAVARATRESIPGQRAPASWIRALVGDAVLPDVDADVLAAVATWATDPGNNVEAARDVVPDPEAWWQQHVSRM